MKQLIYLPVFIIALMASARLDAQNSDRQYNISGKVVDAKTGEAIVGAAVNIEDTGIWTISDEKGGFTLPDIKPGTYSVLFSCLGYVDKTLSFTVRRDISELTIKLSLNTLALNGVVVTAQQDKEGMNTSLKFGSNALSHLQMTNVTDIGSLLPGGKTVNPDLTSEHAISLRSGGLAVGNAAFGTAIEVDGVRLGNNASFGSMSGTGTRSISTENVQSIEVITGVPSAEYGDLNSGMVKINTRKGRTPLGVTFSVNPRTYQVSASKGIDLQDNKGILNISAEWTRATQKLSSPYTSYTRRGFSASYSNTFHKVLRFEAGVTGNIGGMNTKNDPDAYVGTWTKVRDNVLRANTSLVWQLRKPWITNVKLDASVNFNDNLSRDHQYHSSASELPSVHSETEGYYLADRLPKRQGHAGLPALRVRSTTPLCQE